MCSVARGHRFFKWKMLRESRPYAMLLIQLLIALVTWSLVNDSASSRDISFTSYDTVNSLDRPPQLGAVGPVVYALNEFSSLSSFVIRCRFGDLIIHCRQPGREPECVGRIAPPSWLRSPLGLVACNAYVFQWVYNGKQPSIVSLVTTSRLSGNQLEDDGSSVCVLSLACIASSQPS